MRVLIAPQIFALRIIIISFRLAVWLLLTAYGNLSMSYSTVTLLAPYGHLFYQNMDPEPENLHDALWLNCISVMVTGNINRLQTFANALSNAAIADPPLPLKTDPFVTFAGC